jgi:hypothetical protein
VNLLLNIKPLHKKSRPISRILSPINWSLIIYLVPILLSGSIFLPFDNGREPLNADILEISPHRVYLVSLQRYLYILSVALVLIPINRNRRALPAMLLCGVRTFLPDKNRDDKAVCSANLVQ